MTVQVTTQIIQLILAPVVMITSCALVLGGLISRYAAINDRMRLMARERLELWRNPAGAVQVTEDFRSERIQEIDMQVPDLLRRHQLLHHSVLTVYIAILLFVLCMFVIALAAVSDSAALATVVLIIFLCGTGGLLIAVSLAIVEVRASHRSVEYEIRHVSSLGK